MILANTYEELYEILSLMDKSTVMKVLIEILNTIKEQRNPEYKTNIDKTDLFNENNVNIETIENSESSSSTEYKESLFTKI